MTPQHPRYLVRLTRVRPSTAPMAGRDERIDPEPVVETVSAADLASAVQIFDAWKALPGVRGGRLRVKLVELAGQDTWHPAAFGAPLLTGHARTPR